MISKLLARLRRRHNTLYLVALYAEEMENRIPESRLHELLAA